MSSGEQAASGGGAGEGGLPMRHPADVAAVDQHVGITLAATREARGMTLDQLAAQLKISPKKLSLLERGEFEQIEGGATYVRALCRSVCKALRMDEAAILDRLPITVRSNLPERDTSLRTPFKEHAPRDAMSLSSAQRKGLPVLVWAAAALVLAAGLVFAWPWISAVLSSMQSLAAVTGWSGDRAQSAAPQSEPVSLASTQAALNQASVNPAALSVARPAAAVQASPAGPSSAPTAGVSSPATAADSMVDPAQALIIEAVETTWVEIKSPGGVILVSRNVAAGERLLQDLEGRRVITIGNVSGARVLVRGKPFDLLAVKRDNVARFDVQ